MEKPDDSPGWAVANPDCLSWQTDCLLATLPDKLPPGEVEEFFSHVQGKSQLTMNTYCSGTDVCVDAVEAFQNSLKRLVTEAKDGHPGWPGQGVDRQWEPFDLQHLVSIEKDEWKRKWVLHKRTRGSGSDYVGPLGCVLPQSMFEDQACVLAL